MFVSFISQNASAFVPSNVYLFDSGAHLLTLGTSSPSVAPLAVGATALGIGTVVGYIGVGAICNQSATCTAATADLRIPLTAAMAVPAPSAPATHAPTASYQYVSVNPSFTVTSDTIQGLVAAYAAAWTSATGGGYALVVCADGVSTKTQYNGANISACYAFTGYTSVGGCPTGYVANGSSCMLSDPRAATPDSKCDMSRSGSALSMISDPDCTSPQQAMQMICDGVSFTCQGGGVDHLGNPYYVSLSPDSKYGGTNVTIGQQSNPTGSQTVVTTTNFTVDGSGAVTQTNVQSAPGSIAPGTQNVTNPASAVAPTNTVSNSPFVQQSGGTITLPTDYARQGEAATAATTVVTALNTAPADNTLTAEKSTFDTNANNHKQYLDTLGNKAQDTEGGTLTMPLAQPVLQEVCTDPVVTFGASLGSSHTVTFTGFCDSIMKVRAFLQWVLYVFTAYSLFVIVTRRTEEAA